MKPSILESRRLEDVGETITCNNELTELLPKEVKYSNHIMPQKFPKTILVYTFRTFPHLQEIKYTFSNSEVLVIGKIKQDLELLYSQILEKHPDLIFGVALSNNSNSFFEPKAINQFNRKTKILKNGKDELSLYIPNINKSKFLTSTKPTTSFCNYTMYQLQNFLESTKLNIPFVFSHLRKEDIKELSYIFDTSN